VTPDRCPACNAAVTASAQWCTLCYASLRVPETVPQTVPAEAAPVPVAPPYSAPLPPDPILDAPILDAPVFQAPPVVGTEAKGWPCLGCGAMVPIEDNACSQCGRPFLPSDDGPSLALPGIGDLSRMDRGQRLVVALAAAGLVTGLIVLLMFVGGSVL
jgi:hypothetical protein